MITFTKMLFVTLLALSPRFVFAKLIEQDKINFPIKTEELFQGDIFYFFKMLSPRELSVQFPELYEIDSLSLIQESNVEMIIEKSVSIVDRPVGFFDDKQVADEKFLSHIMGEQKVKKMNPNTFRVSSADHSYRMQLFFDSDDISTLPNSKIIRAVGVARKLDVISQGASSIILKEMTNFTKYTEGGVAISSYVPLKENKTLVITYQLWAVKKPIADKESLKENFLSETEALQKLHNNFK